jgi:hypothetical protein
MSCVLITSRGLYATNSLVTFRTVYFSKLIFEMPLSTASRKVGAEVSCVMVSCGKKDVVNTQWGVALLSGQTVQLSLWGC